MAGSSGSGQDREQWLSAADACFHAVPLVAAVAEEVGPFTLFRPRGHHPYFARPRPGTPAPDQGDLARLDQRCRELGLPLALEWMWTRSPGLAGVSEAFDLEVDHDLLLAAGAADLAADDPVDDRVEVLAADSPRLGAALATASVAFAAPGVEPGDGGVAERRTMQRLFPAERIAETAERITTGHTVMTAAALDGEVVAVGQYRRAGPTAEIVAVTTLPAFRRRGLATAVTRALVRHAVEQGVTLLVLATEENPAVRVYEEVGFIRLDHVGRAGRPGRRG